MHEVPVETRALNKMLGIRIVPGVLGQIWNSTVAHFAADEFSRDSFLTDVFTRSAMTRLRMQGDWRERVFHGAQIKNASSTFRVFAPYYQVHTHASQRTGILSVGIMGAHGKNGSPSQHDALCIDFNYTNKSMPRIAVRVNHTLGVANPDTRDQMMKTLEETGHIMSLIRNGFITDLAWLRLRLVIVAGLRPLRTEMAPIYKGNLQYWPSDL